MWQRLKAYARGVDELLDTGSPDTDWERVLREHRDQIAFFQHERLVHLLVSLAFALMELACALVTIVTGELIAAALMALFLVPLVPYVVHYYHLENGTQRLYAQYDALLRRLG